jgi:predicted dehydrogenase/threonine dehydrogenase-like Zn-dependent dehydrogenase
MKQVLRKGLKEIVVDEVPDPVVAPHHIIIRPSYSLISSGTETASIHTDSLLTEVADNPSHLTKIWNAFRIYGATRTVAEVKAKFDEYAVLGYSGAGVIVDAHPTVSNLKIGDRVSYGGEGTGHGEAIMTGQHLVARIPDEVSFEAAAFTTLGSIALNAVRTAAIGIGDTVVVIGLGLVGQLITQLVRSQGGVVIGVDLKAERVALAKQLGADHAVLGGAGAEAEISSLTQGLGADCVIIAAAAKSSAPCAQALRFCRDRGQIVVVGAVELAFDWNEMYLKEIKLFMSRAYGPGSYDPSYEKQGHDYPISYVRWTENRNMQAFLNLVATGKIQVEPLITHRFQLENAADAYQTILDPASNSLAVVLRYPAADDVTEFQTRTKIAVTATRAHDGDLRVGLIGAGNLARWAHLPNLKSLDRVSLRAICSTNGARGKSYARRFSAAYCSTDYADLLQDPEIDLIVILTRNQHHASQALAALRAGKHVFVEKPMALTVEECSALNQAVAETGKQLTVGFNRRFAPFYREQKQQLSRRSTPAVLNCRVNSPGISGSYWMADPKIGGAILGEACHFVDLMYWLLQSEPVSVSAYCLPTGSDDPVGENNMTASFLFADGSVGNLTYCTVGSATSAGERVEAFAPGLGVVTDDFKRLTISGSARRSRSRLWPEKGYAEQMKEFIESIRTSRPPEVTVRDGARATLACLKMLESAQNHLPCQIDLDVEL